jgi:Rod binding domain-containing protein
MTIQPVFVSPLQTSSAVTSNKAGDAAKQFESLLIGQMLRSAHEDDDDSEKSTMLDVADQQFAQVLANSGGLGLAKMIVTGLKAAD